MADDQAVRDLELVHTCDADVARVDRAWSHREELRTWWRGTGPTTRTFEADVRPDRASAAVIEGDDRKPLSYHGRHDPTHENPAEVAALIERHASPAQNGN